MSSLSSARANKTRTIFVIRRTARDRLERTSVLCFATMSGSRAGVFSTAVLLSVVASASIAAAAPRVAALVPAMKPAAAPELRDRFHEAVTRGITTAGGVETVPAGEVRMRLAISEEQLTCSAAGVCAARAALTLRTDRLVATELNIVGKTYGVKVRLLDAAGREIAKADETCDICTVKEADDAIARAASKLIASNAALITEAKPVAAAEPPKPVEPPPEAKKPVEHKVAGKLVSRKGAALVVELEGDELPEKGANAELFRKLDKPILLFPAGMTMGIAATTVDKVEGKKVSMTLAKETSTITVNGKKVDHFVKGTTIRLDWTTPPKP